MKLRFGITGSTGSLGKNLIKVNKNIKFIKFKGDVRNKSKVRNWIKDNKLDVLIHLAAIVPIKTVNKNKKKAYYVNYYGTKNIVDEILNSRIKWFFFFIYFTCLQIIKKKNIRKLSKRPDFVLWKNKVFS